MAVNRNLGELRAAVLDITPPHNDVTLFLNEAQRKLLKETLRKRTVVTPVVAGAADVPAEALFVRAVYYESYPLEVFPQERTPGADVTGTPVYYAVEEGKIRLYPALVNGVIEVIICPAPTEMSLDSDFPTVKDADNALIAYAKHMVYAFNEDPGLADFWQKRWLTEATEWVANDNKTIKKSHRVRVGPYI